MPRLHDAVSSRRDQSGEAAACVSAMRRIVEIGRGFLGEPIPIDVLNMCAEHSAKADLVIVAGTSATVYPAAGFALEVKERGGILIEVNLYESEITQYCEVSLRGGSAEVLPRLVKAVDEIRRETMS